MMVFSKLVLIIKKPENLMAFIKNRLVDYPLLKNKLKIFIQKTPKLRQYLVSNGLITDFGINCSELNNSLTLKEKYILDKLSEGK